MEEVGSSNLPEPIRVVSVRFPNRCVREVDEPEPLVASFNTNGSLGVVVRAETVGRSDRVSGLGYRLSRPVVSLVERRSFRSVDAGSVGCLEPFETVLHPRNRFEIRLPRLDDGRVETDRQPVRDVAVTPRFKRRCLRDNSVERRERPVRVAHSSTPHTVRTTHTASSSSPHSVYVPRCVQGGLKRTVATSRYSRPSRHATLRHVTSPGRR